MINKAQRFVLCCLAALAGLPLMNKSHGFPDHGKSVAFVRSGDDTVRVMVTGVDERSGVYVIPRGGEKRTVIIMAVLGLSKKESLRLVEKEELKDGEILALSSARSECVEFKRLMMGARERMLLGIPLDPKSMNESDWESLPGIGPKLAKAIIFDRQHNGDFHSFRDLERVPGIGPAMTRRLQQYF